MDIYDVSDADFALVMLVYRGDHAAKNDWWEERNLQRAHDKFGFWIKAKISVSDIGKIVMPQYQHGGFNITPQAGSYLEDAYANFKKNYELFMAGNPQFCDRVKVQKVIIQRTGLKPVFLSEEPLFIGSSYSGLINFKNKITHLDGFHRLFAVMDLLQEQKFPSEYVDCFIAVYEDSKLRHKAPDA